MTTSLRTFVTTGYVDNVVLFHEYGLTPGPLTVYATRAEYEAANPDRAEHEYPHRITVTYQVEVSDSSHDGATDIADSFAEDGDTRTAREALDTLLEDLL